MDDAALTGQTDSGNAATARCGCSGITEAGSSDIFASIAEFERELIRDRVRSGLAAAKAKGKRIGRPKVTVDVPRITSLRRQGRSWAEITRATGVSKGTAQRALASACPKAFLQPAD